MQTDVGRLDQAVDLDRITIPNLQQLVIRQYILGGKVVHRQQLAGHQLRYWSAIAVKGNLHRQQIPPNLQEVQRRLLPMNAVIGDLQIAHGL